MQVPEYDYTIIGAGCSGWQLAYALMQHEELRTKRIAICDLGAKLQRSWCFWSDDDTIFPELVQKSWSQLHFAAPNFDTKQQLSNYSYNYISGEKFFHYFETEFLEKHPNIVLLKSEVSTVIKNSENYTVNFTSGSPVRSAFIFDSRNTNMIEANKNIFLWQHFRGWFIETETEFFDAQKATLMDFTISQGSEVRFMYVLPFSKTKALIEFTIFSKDIFDDATYDEEIKKYIAQTLKMPNFKIVEVENGAIPMTNFAFQKSVDANYINIGTNSGAVKPSTGYAFKRIHADSKIIAASLAKGENIKKRTAPKRFHFYDNILLRILAKEPERGAPIFRALFKNMPMENIIRFLDEKTSFSEDFSILSSVPSYPFIKHLFL